LFKISFIGHEQGVAIIEEYDKNPYIICIHWLNLKVALLTKEWMKIVAWISLK